MVYCRKKTVLFDEDSEKEHRQLSSEHHSLGRLCRVCSVERKAPDCSTCCRSDQLDSENGWGDQSWACWVDMWIYSLGLTFVSLSFCLFLKQKQPVYYSGGDSRTESHGGKGGEDGEGTTRAELEAVGTVGQTVLRDGSWR